MKGFKVLLSRALIIITLGLGVENVVYANSLTPLSLIDINALPAVATDANDNVTITWGYLGLKNIPGILAKRYGPDGNPIDNRGFWVSSPFAAPSIFNYDPDIATDSANNSIITWCSYQFSSPPKNIQVVYTKVAPPDEASRTISKVRTISPQQEDDEEEEINLLNIPFSPVIAVDSSDNIAIAWAYYDFKSSENGIYLEVIDSEGTAIDPVKIVDNIEDSTSTDASTSGKAVKKGAILSNSIVKPILYHSPSIAFDGDGNIVVTWTATGMLPCFLEDIELPSSVIFYSKYDTSGTVVSGYDKQTVAIGFKSAVDVDSNGNMIIVWNRFDIFTLEVRIMAAIYSTEESSSRGSFEVGVRSTYASSNYVDDGSHFLNTGINVAADSEGNFFCTWSGRDLFSTHIYLRKIYSNGELSNEKRVSQGFDTNYGPSIAVDNRGYIIVTWNRFSLFDLFTGPVSVYARRYDNNLQALEDEFKVNISY